MKKNKLKQAVEVLEDADQFSPDSEVVTLDLDDATMKIIDERMATGMYLSKGEVIREAIRQHVRAVELGSLDGGGCCQGNGDCCKSSKKHKKA